MAHLSAFASAYPHQLSGGMRRRVALLMGLANDPEILLLDEPFGALDTHTKTHLHRELIDIRQKLNQTVVMVTHDLDEAVTLSDRVIVLSSPPSRILLDERIDIAHPRDVFTVRQSERFSLSFQPHLGRAGPGIQGKRVTLASLDIAQAGPALPAHAEHLAQVRRDNLRQARRVVLCQSVILAAFLLSWEVLTRIPWMTQNTIYDPFFISRPSLIIARIAQWVVPGPHSLWPNLWGTLSATSLGLLIGVSSGFAVGLALAQNRFLARVFNPFIVTLNSMPRIAFVPLITMMFGLGIASKVVTVWFVVFFLIFFNTYKGCLSVERELLEFCQTLGGRPHQILWRVRIPYAAAWTFAALPNAVSFALVSVVLVRVRRQPQRHGLCHDRGLAARSTQPTCSPR